MSEGDEETVSFYDLEDARTEARDEAIEECIKVVASFIQYGGDNAHGVTCNPYADATRIIRALRELLSKPASPLLPEPVETEP